MMGNDVSRSKLEKRIVEIANGVPVLQSDWTSSTELGQFIDVWYDLAKFYEENTDTVIGVDAVAEYVSFMRLLRRLMCDDKMGVMFRRQAEEQLNALESAMEEVIKEAVSNLYYDSP